MLGVPILVWYLAADGMVSERYHKSFDKGDSSVNVAKWPVLVGQCGSIRHCFHCFRGVKTWLSVAPLLFQGNKMASKYKLTALIIPYKEFSKMFFIFVSSKIIMCFHNKLSPYNKIYFFYKRVRKFVQEWCKIKISPFEKKKLTLYLHRQIKGNYMYILEGVKCCCPIDLFGT